MSRLHIIEPTVTNRAMLHCCSFPRPWIPHHKLKIRHPSIAQHKLKFFSCKTGIEF